MQPKPKNKLQLKYGVSYLHRSARMQNKILKRLGFPKLNEISNPPAKLVFDSNCIMTPSVIGMCVDFYFFHYAKTMNRNVVRNGNYKDKQKDFVVREMLKNKLRKHLGLKFTKKVFTELPDALLFYILDIIGGRLCAPLPTGDFLSEYKTDIEFLRGVLSKVPHHEFVAKQRCFYNKEHPYFGYHIDMLIDDALIDVKTVERCKIEKQYIVQLIVYYTLYRIAGIPGEKRKRPIKYVGIYFARHGVLWKQKISDLIPEKKMKAFVEWFKKEFMYELKK